MDKKADPKVVMEEEPSVTLSDKENEDSYEPSPVKGQKKKVDQSKKTYYIKKKEKHSPVKNGVKAEATNGKLRKRDMKA